MLNLVIIASIVPEIDKRNVYNNVKAGIFESAVALQNKIINGLNINLSGNFRICNVEPIYSFPLYYKRAFIEFFRFHYQDKKLCDLNVCFNNITGFRFFSMTDNIVKCLEKMNQELKIDGIIVYSTRTCYLEAVKIYTRMHPKTKICLITPDLPDFGLLVENPSLKARIVHYFSKKQFFNFCKIVSSMVFLTKQTAEYLNWQDKKYAVVEGIADAVNNNFIKSNKNGIKTIVYTGLTHKKFGMGILLDSMKYLDKQDIKLIICGCGDSDQRIKEEAEKDKRIEFLSVVPHEKAIELQNNATILVNPRQNKGEFTKYSYPSKTMEYLVTGNPVVAYKLDGMPDEYDDYIIRPGDDSPQELAKCFNNVLGMSEEQRETIGNKGKQFVLKYKNPIVQVKKILDLFDE